MQFNIRKEKPKDKSSKKIVDKVVPSDISSINIKLGVVDVNMVLVEDLVVATVGVGCNIGIGNCNHHLMLLHCMFMLL
jgi:hypothetical protein